jgi:hypothetical protein
MGTNCARCNGVLFDMPFARARRSLSSWMWATTRSAIACARLRHAEPSTHRALLTQFAASAGHRAPEAGRLHSAPRYQPHRAQAHSVLRHAMHPGTVGPLANRPRPHPPVGTGSRPRSCNHRLASRSRCWVWRQNNLGIYKCHATPEIAITGPGTFALNCRPIHSSG